MGKHLQEEEKERVEKGQEGREEWSVACNKVCEAAEWRMRSSGSKKKCVHVLCVCFTERILSFPTTPSLLCEFISLHEYAGPVALVCTRERWVPCLGDGSGQWMTRAQKARESLPRFLLKCKAVEKTPAVSNVRKLWDGRLHDHLSKIVPSCLHAQPRGLCMRNEWMNEVSWHLELRASQALYI